MTGASQRPHEHEEAGALALQFWARIGCVVLAAGLLGMTAPEALAQQDDATADPYTVTVPVDATSSSATVARDTARVDGERRAYQIVLQGLVSPADVARLPPANDATLNDLILGFEVANEHNSSVHYLADYTFHFRPDAVRRLLRQAHIGFADTASTAAVDTGSSGTLAISVPIADIQSWVAINQQLVGVTAIQKTDLLTLDRHMAQIAVHYNGSLDQLRQALTQQNLDLSGDPPNLVLAYRPGATP